MAIILLGSNSNEISNWLQSSLAVVNHPQPHHCTAHIGICCWQSRPPLPPHTTPGCPLCLSTEVPLDIWLWCKTCLLDSSGLRSCVQVHHTTPQHTGTNKEVNHPTLTTIQTVSGLSINQGDFLPRFYNTSCDPNQSAYLPGARRHFPIIQQ